MREFKIPPTDRRYIDTPFEMMEFLFLDFLESIDPKDISTRYKRYQATKEERDKFYKELDTLDDDLKMLGHNEETIKAIKEEYKMDWEKNHDKNRINR